MTLPFVINNIMTDIGITKSTASLGADDNDDGNEDDHDDGEYELDGDDDHDADHGEHYDHDRDGISWYIGMHI